MHRGCHLFNRNPLPVAARHLHIRRGALRDKGACGVRNSGRYSNGRGTEEEEAMTPQSKSDGKLKALSNHHGPTVPDLEPKWQGHVGSMFHTDALHFAGYSL